MSYRAFKRLLGETSLERKCRFLFGAGILLLITASFWLYALQTESLAYDQVKTTGRLLVNPLVWRLHLGHVQVNEWEWEPLQREDRPRGRKGAAGPELGSEEWNQLRLALDELWEENLREAVRSYQYRIIKPKARSR